MSQRKRDKFTNWSNQEPIADVYEALEMLKSRQQGRYNDTRFLMREPQDEIMVDWYHEADSGGDRSGYDYYEIDPTIVEQLVKERWVTSNVVKFWGGSRTENHKMVISTAGKYELQKYLETTQEDAKKLVVPGKHTKFSGILNSRGYGRDGHQGCGGELYFDFETPMQERLRVFLTSKRVVDRAKERA